MPRKQKPVRSDKESERPMTVEIWQRVEEEAAAHLRPE